MKTLAYAILPLSIFAATSAFAQEEEAAFYPNHYWGMQVGSYDTSLNQESQEFSHTSVGVFWGYRFHEYVSGELAGHFSIGGEPDDVTSSYVGDPVEVETSALGAYLVAQTKGDFYGKARLGLAQSSFTYTAAGYEDETESTLGLAYGIGAGFRVNNYSFEAEYQILPTVDDPLFDVDYDTSVFTIGFVYDFK